MSVTFVNEHKANIRSNELHISSVCNAKCIFCSNESNPFNIERLGFRDMEEIREAIPRLQPEKFGYIALRGFRRISEGECVLHPRFFEILSLLRQNFKDIPIVFDTNGSQFTDEFILKLKEFLPIRIYISYHSNNREFWKKIFKLQDKHYEIATSSFSKLKSLGFEIVGCITSCPNLVGYDDLENTVKFLSKYSKSIEGTGVTWTKRTDPSVVDLLKSDFKEINAFYAKMAIKYCCEIGSDPAVNTDLEFFPQFAIKKLNSKGFKNIFWLLSECAFSRAEKIIMSCQDSTNHHSRLVKNISYGGNVIVSGLLLVEDYRAEIKAILQEGLTPDLILLPASPFDKFGFDLSQEQYRNLEEEFKTPIRLVQDLSFNEEPYLLDPKDLLLKDLPLQTYRKSFYNHIFKGCEF